MKFIKGMFAKSMIKSLAKSNNGRTTILGFMAAALLAQQIDWGLALSGDSQQLGTAAGAIIAALIGYLTNRPDKAEPIKAEDPIQ